MKENRILKKMLAILLIFTLTSANFLFVGQSFALTIDDLFGTEDSSNVEFSSFFVTEANDRPVSVISDVNNEELAIELSLSVKDSGYLKDAKIKIESEEGKELNFVLGKMDESNSLIQGIEDNEISLKQVDSNVEANIVLPIMYKYEKYVNDDMISNKAMIKLTGTYVNDKGNNIDVEYQDDLFVSWVDTQEVKVDSSLEKYIDYGDGMILQTLVKVDGTSEDNTLPVRETTLDIEVPTLNGQAPTDVMVVANRTENTNGETAENVTFNDSNFEYSDNHLMINVDNEKKMITFNEFEDEYLIDQDKLKVEERYYNESGIDEFLVTYVYEGLEEVESEEVSSNVSTQVSTYSANNDSENTNVVTTNDSFTYDLKEQVGSLVSLNIENETEEVSKSNIYSNYSNSQKLETEFNSSEIMNISNKDIIDSLILTDVSDKYVSKDGTETDTNDMYIKSVSIQAENFKNILGEDGYVRVFDRLGNQVIELNKSIPSEVYTYDYQNVDNYLKVETSKPVSEGNLVLNVKRAVKDSSISKEEMKNVSELKVTSELFSKYEYVDDLKEVGTVENTVKLNDTYSKVNLVMDKDSLSTLSLNENVKLTLELNNDKEWSDIYGDSSFIITLPENVESVKINEEDSSIANGEGLEIKSIEVIDNNKIKVEISGTQTGPNSSVLTNGTNIIVDADIKVNELTPTKTDDVKVEFTNNEATNYDEEEVKINISYSAPKGFVSVNSISGYKEGGSVLSVSQGNKTDTIDVHTDAKNAEMKLYMMNNTESSVSNLKILGRFPFSDMDDMVTDSKLGSGTTVDARILSGIASNNDAEFKVYYSENEKADADLDNSENGWQENVQDVSNMKSYLIVPGDENYEVEPSETLDFTYGFEIPADLPHNETIAGTYTAYYTSHENNVDMNLISFPDIVELTTGNGPELGLDVSVDKDTVREYDEFPVTAVIKNIGKEKAEDIVVEMPMPTGADYVENSAVVDGLDIEASVTVENGILRANIPSIEMNREANLSLNLKARELLADEGSISTTFTAQAKDLGTTLESKKDIKVENAELAVEEYNVSKYSENDDIFMVGDTISRVVKVKNLSNKELKNLVVTKEISDNFEVVKAELNRLENDVSVKISDGKVDGNNIVWNIDKIEPEEALFMPYTLKVAQIEDGLTTKDVEARVRVESNDTETYEVRYDIKISKAVISLRQSTDTDVNNPIKENDRVKYLFEIENNSNVTISDLKFEDNIPDRMDLKKIHYSNNGNEYEFTYSNASKAEVPTIKLGKGEITKIEIECTPKIMTESYESTATNIGKVYSDKIKAIESNPITHIIKVNKAYAMGEKDTSGNDSENGVASENAANSQGNANYSNSINRTYKVSGYVWNDKNRDGVRDSGEQPISSEVEVKLIESNTGTIKKTVKPNGEGLYELSGVENGTYFVLYDYDTIKYGITTYHKAGISDEVNSDAMPTTLTQEGKMRKAAVSDKITVNNGSVTNIDLGIFEADKFDMALEMGITKVTMQGPNGTTTHNYDGSKLVKEDLAAKYLAGTTVLVEYEIKITNKGDLAGYAKKIADYIPADMKFNSTYGNNSDWYSTTDGSVLYTTKFENREFAPGESETIKLVLLKEMTDENTGLVNNNAEIIEDYNIYGVTDYNSTPGNKAQNENDMSSSDIIILIKTGETLIYTSVIITTIVITGLAILVVSRKIVQLKRKGGV